VLGFVNDLPAYQPTWRGQAGSTMQQWAFTTSSGGEFSHSDTHVTASPFTNLNGTPQADIVAQAGGVGWVAGNNADYFAYGVAFSTNGVGWWDLGFDGGGSISLTIPTAVGSVNAIRYLSIQITEAIEPSYYEPATVVVTGGTQAGSDATTQIEVYNNQDSGIRNNYVNVRQQLWQVPGNTASAMVTITGATTGGRDSVVGGIVVDASPLYPQVSNPTYTRSKDLSWKIKVADLLTNASPAGHSFSLLSVAGASHGSASISGDWVLYQPTQPDQNVTDSFTYLVKDNDINAQNSGTVTLNVVAQQPGQSAEITVSNGAATVVFSGIPGYAYDVQRSDDVNFTTFTVVLTTNAPAGGVFTWVDNTAPPTAAYYRLKPH
jgi:hypothetical protein